MSEEEARKRAEERGYAYIKQLVEESRLEEQKEGVAWFRREFPEILDFLLGIKDDFLVDISREKLKKFRETFKE